MSRASPRKTRRARQIINYGTTATLLVEPGARVLNYPHHVGDAINKAETLSLLTTIGVPCLEYTDDPEIAKKWLPEGRSVVCRTVLNGHSGKGIHIVKWSDWKAGGRVDPQFPQGVKLYTKYFPKQEEVRVHVFAGEIIGYAAKRRKAGVQADPWVRSHANGWIFATDGVIQNADATDAACTAVRELGLDFAAVDIGIGRDGVAVFEVNTAPGLEGRTLAAYIGKFKQHFGIRER